MLSAFRSSFVGKVSRASWLSVETCTSEPVFKGNVEWGWEVEGGNRKGAEEGGGGPGRGRAMLWSWQHDVGFSLAGTGELAVARIGDGDDCR